MRTEELMEKHARGTLTPPESSELIERLDNRVVVCRLKVQRVRRSVGQLPEGYRVALIRELDK